MDDGVYNTSTGVKTSSTPDGLTDYYFPTVVMYSDYDPFGTQQDGRKLNTTSYKYGFQGQEADNEIKLDGNSWNYEYRMHDPRIGRFFAVDPLAPKYAYNSPYAFSENSMIAFIELEGLEKITHIYNWNPEGGYYEDEITINLGFGFGEAWKWVGGPNTPTGWDFRMLSCLDGDCFDFVGKFFSTIMSEYKPVLKVEVESKVAIPSELNINTRVFDATATVKAQIQKTEITITNDGEVEAEVTGPCIIYGGGGGMFGVLLEMLNSTDGTFETGIVIDKLEMNATEKPNGDRSSTVLVTVGESSATAAGITTTTTTKVGYERKGAGSMPYEEAIKRNEKTAKGGKVAAKTPKPSKSSNTQQGSKTFGFEGIVPVFNYFRAM